MGRLNRFRKSDQFGVSCGLPQRICPKSLKNKGKVNKLTRVWTFLVGCRPCLGDFPHSYRLCISGLGEESFLRHRVEFPGVCLLVRAAPLPWVAGALPTWPDSCILCSRVAAYSVDSARYLVGVRAEKQDRFGVSRRPPSRI